MNSVDFRPDAATISAQCALVLNALVDGPKTTAQLHGIGVLSPAARVLSLRRAGLRVKTLRSGRQAEYLLERGDVQP